MDSNKFDQLAIELLDKTKETLTTKRKEYAGDKDVFHNFEQGIKLSMHKHREAYAWELCVKHLQSVKDIIGNVENLPSEDMIREKFGDIRAYMILMEIMLLQRKINLASSVRQYPLGTEECEEWHGDRMMILCPRCGVQFSTPSKSAMKPRCPQCNNVVDKIKDTMTINEWEVYPNDWFQNKFSDIENGMVTMLWNSNKKGIIIPTNCQFHMDDWKEHKELIYDVYNGRLPWINRK